MQIKLAGMNIKDFAEFIQANQILDDLYETSKRYEGMDSRERNMKLLALQYGQFQVIHLDKHISHYLVKHF